MAGRPGIVVLDGATLGPEASELERQLTRIGTVAVFPRTPPSLAVERAAGARIVLCNKTPIDRAAFEVLEDLALVCVLATGYDRIDVHAAREHGVVVSNVPDYCTDSVAEHTIALLLELTRRVGMHDAAVKAGEWALCPDWCFWKAPLTDLAGLTMGIVGFGRIGRRVGRLARAFGMTVVAAGRSRTRAPRWRRFRWLSIDELFACADVVSLHCPETAETRGLVNRERLSRMKPTALLLNVARGGLVNADDLAEALARGVIAGAATDVLPVEPPPKDLSLAGLSSCVVTPHVAWATTGARRRLVARTLRNVRAFLAGRPIHVVNRSGNAARSGRAPGKAPRARAARGRRGERW
jgi:glycerate dehydrogenase